MTFTPIRPPVSFNAWYSHTVYITVRKEIHKQLRQSSGTAVYPHMPILRVACAHARVAHALAAQRELRNWFVRFGASGGAKFPKMGDSLSRTPTNHRTKFDAGFILAGEIRNRIQTQKKTNEQDKQTTAADISTPCLSACVDNNTKNTKMKLTEWHAKWCINFDLSANEVRHQWSLLTFVALVTNQVQLQQHLFPVERTRHRWRHRPGCAAWTPTCTD